LLAAFSAGLSVFGQQESLWHRDFSSPDAYQRSTAANRQRFRGVLGMVDVRLPAAAIEVVGGTADQAKVAGTEAFRIQAVRWPVFEGVFGEGLLLQPRTNVVARIIAIPDADQTPEMLCGLAPGLAAERQFARRLAENGCEVLVPALIDRQTDWSGIASLNSIASQPHREWIDRLAVPFGRRVIGYEVQKVLAAVDSLQTSPVKTGVVGYGEGGLIAFCAAALDPRIESALVSGWFDSRRRMWEEPPSRNLFGLLPEFGDAETATLIAPRSLTVEYSAAPIGGKPPKLGAPDYESVEAEFQRARALLKAGNPKDFDRLNLISGAEGMMTGPGSDRALVALLNGLGVPIEQVLQPGQPPAAAGTLPDPARQRRQIEQLETFTLKLAR